MDHKKVDCPSLTGGVVAAPAPMMLRITDGREGKQAAPIVKSKAFQLMDEEAHATPDVVTDLFFHLFMRFHYFLYLCFLL